MDRAEFTRKFLEQINFVIRSTQRATEKRIEARQSRVDSASFQKWIIDERDKVLSIPAFGPFDQANRKHMGTPNEAAETVAQWVDFYFEGVVDWGEMWGHFQSILRGIYDYPQGIDRIVFLSSTLYRKVVEAETIAATLSEHLSVEKTPPPPAEPLPVLSEHLSVKPGRKAKPPRTFQSCFRNTESMERLLAAAVLEGLIVKDGEGYTWIDEGIKVHRVCAFWFAAVDAGLIKSKLKNSEATTKAIQIFFNMDSLSKDTIERYDPYNKECLSLKSAIEKKIKAATG